MSVNMWIAVTLTLRNYIDHVGKWGSVFILPLVFVTMWDVIVRKLGGVQLWLIENVGSVFESTKIQEWEWHFHTALFVLVLGYGYVNNRHVRVDLLREKMAFRSQAWVEFIGCTLFLIPYTLITSFFAYEYAYEAWSSGEISASTVGLCCRWIIKSVLVIGLIVAAISGIAVWIQTILVLFVPHEALLDPKLNETTTTRFRLLDLLIDKEGNITEHQGSTYVNLPIIPAGKDAIEITDADGPVTFEWRPDSGIIYFHKAPEKDITIKYSHRFQLFTLLWPEEQAIRGARTRDV